MESNDRTVLDKPMNLGYLSRLVEYKAGLSGLAEDILNAPNAQSTLPANDPVRLETAAYIKKCMLAGSTPAPWVMQIVLPLGGASVGPTQQQVEQVRAANLDAASQQNLDCAFLGAQNPTATATPIR